MTVNPVQPKKATLIAISATKGHSARGRVLARRDRLIQENLHLVRPIAERIYQHLPPSFELDDLLQTGRLGLLYAATQYRPGEHDGTPFSAYARIRIHGTIQDSIRRRHYVEATRVPLDESHEQQRAQEAPVEVCIDRKKLARLVDLSREWLNDEQAKVISAYYSPSMPSLATVAANLGIQEWRAVRAHREALEVLRRVLRVA